MQAIVELPEFRQRAKTRMTDKERHELIDFLARTPTAGALVPGTGGVRKLRWTVGGKGKRGGARVIYYLHDELHPIYLLTVYLKNEKPGLKPAERAAMAALTRLLAAELKKRGHHE